MVYFIADEHKRVKIGAAHDVVRRRESLQLANADKLTTLLVLDGYRYEEALIHARFHQHRIRGEWFKLSPEILAFIAAPKAAAEGWPEWYTTDTTVTESNDSGELQPVPSSTQPRPLWLAVLADFT